MCENQKLNQVVGNATDGFKSGGNINQRVFGVLPFLHLNITKSQFKAVLDNSSESITNTVSSLCNKKNLEKTLKAVEFNCRKQSSTGREALLKSVMESIENRWDMRRNGRAVLNKIEKVQREQVKKGLIPAASVAWCCA